MLDTSCISAMFNYIHHKNISFYPLAVILCTVNIHMIFQHLHVEQGIFCFSSKWCFYISISLIKSPFSSLNISVGLMLNNPYLKMIWLKLMIGIWWSNASYLNDCLVVWITSLTYSTLSTLCHLMMIKGGTLYCDIIVPSKE